MLCSSCGFTVYVKQSPLLSLVLLCLTMYVVHAVSFVPPSGMRLTALAWGLAAIRILKCARHG